MTIVAPRAAFVSDVRESHNRILDARLKPSRSEDLGYCPTYLTYSPHPPYPSARSARRSTLPTIVLGSSALNATFAGTL